MPARFIYVQFPGEDSKVITLQDLDSAIHQRSVQVQVPAEGETQAPGQTN